MKSTAFFVLLNALVVFGHNFNPSKTRTNVIPNRFIIEVEHNPSLDRRDGALHPLDVVYHRLQSRDIDLQVKKEFKIHGIFNGAVLHVKNEEDVALIKNTPGVKAVRPVKIFPRPKYTSFQVLDRRHGSYQLSNLARRVITNRADSDGGPDTLSSHILGGVDKVHAEGNTGKGVKIGIIDTGVDYTHPVLGSNGFGPGKKIETGYDFVGDDYASSGPDPTPRPDLDPMDCHGHGTFVAGIIAAEPGNHNFSGVAYGATLGAYKIFGCNGDTSEDVIIDALTRGAADKMDILTLSLGIPDEWSSSLSAVVADRIVQQNNIIIIAAAGNEGAFGSWSIYSPATGKEVIAVGSVDNTVIPFQIAEVHGVDHPPIPYFSRYFLKTTSAFPIYATSNDTAVAADACSPLPKETPNLSQYLVVIRNGTCRLTTKFENAAAKGATRVFIYDNGGGWTDFDSGNSSITLIQATDGEFLAKQFITNAPVNVTFSQGGGPNMTDNHGGLVSGFSSCGPSFDFQFKPALVAPGGNIISTYMASFAVLSGTSFSTPFVAGAAALLLAAKPKSLSAVNGTRTLFETTSTKVLASKNGTGFDTLSSAGAGLINVYNAIHSTTVVSPGELILSDTSHFQGNHTITIQNIGNTEKNYTLNHIPALTALTMKENSIVPSLGPVPLVSNPATVDIKPANFTLQAGASQQVLVSFTHPTGQADRYPLYSGFIEVTSGESESLHVSYMGLAASLKDHQIFDNTTTVAEFPYPTLLKNNTVVVEPTNFTFDEGNPLIAWRLAMGTPALDIDLVEPGPNGRFIGNLLSYDYLGRHEENYYYSESHYNLTKPSFQNNTRIPDGQYRVRVRALRITGDPTKEEDYVSWLSPMIGIWANRTFS